MHCDTIRTIVRLPNRDRTGEIAYAPIQHSEPDRHKGCGGIAYRVDAHEVENVDIGITHACEACEVELFPADVTIGEAHCPGVGRAIVRKRGT